MVISCMQTHTRKRGLHCFLCFSFFSQFYKCVIVVCVEPFICAETREDYVPLSVASINFFGVPHVWFSFPYPQPSYMHMGCYFA
jgi:hypothetical protein